MLRPTPATILLGSSDKLRKHPGYSDNDNVPRQEVRAPNNSTNFELLQRALKSEDEVIELRKQVAFLEEKLARNDEQYLEWKATDPFYYVPPVSVLPPPLAERYREAIDALVEHAVLYRESFMQLQPGSLNQASGGNLATSNPRVSRMMRQLQHENEMLRKTIARLQHQRAQYELTE